MKLMVDLTPLHFDGRVGGAMPFSLELVKAFSLRSEISLTVLTGEWNDGHLRNYFTSAKIRYVNTSLPVEQQTHMPSRPSWLQKCYDFFGKVKRRIYRDRIVAQQESDILFCPLSAITFWQAGRATVSTILDIQHEFYPQFFDPVELQHRRSFYEKICNKADAIICISDYTRSTFIERLGFPSEKSFVAHIGIQNRLQFFDEALVEADFSELGLEGIRYAYYPANFWPHKNHKVLLIAFAAFCRHYPQFDLHLVFTGNELSAQDELMQAIRRLGIADRVHVLGYVQEVRLAALYRYCQFVVFPSLYEGFGIPVVEAMQFGKPVLCSDRTSLPEIAGEAAIYFDPRIPGEIEQAMFRVMADADLQQSLRSKGCEQAQQFTMEKMVNQYLTIFRTVLQK